MGDVVFLLLSFLRSGNVVRRRSEEKMLNHNGVAMTDVSKYDHERYIIVAVDIGNDFCRGRAALANC